MQIKLYNWDSLFERAIDKPFNSKELNAKDQARAWFENNPRIRNSESVEDAIDNWIKTQKEEPFFDEFGNFVCFINKGTYWRYD